MKSERNKPDGFSLQFSNGCTLSFERPFYNSKQKSYSILFNDGKDNVWYKVGLIKDISVLNKLRETR